MFVRYRLDVHRTEVLHSLGLRDLEVLTRAERRELLERARAEEPQIVRVDVRFPLYPLIPDVLLDMF